MTSTYRPTCRHCGTDNVSYGAIVEHGPDGRILVADILDNGWCAECERHDVINWAAPHGSAKLA